MTGAQRGPAPVGARLGRRKDMAARTVPARWEQSPAVKQPGKNASAAELAQYRPEKKLKNPSRQFVSLGQELRQHRNPTGHAAKPRISRPTVPAGTAPCRGAP